MSTIQATNLVLAYDRTCIVEGMTLSIPAGQITVLVGPNGCGKSTLLRGLSRLLQPSGGSVLLDGQNIWKLRTKELAKQLGILPQGPVVPEGLTVHELVAQGRYPHQGWLQQWSAEDERITNEAMAITGVTEYADRPVDTLSGGQRQRAWIAMTLAQDSDIILLDEPTTFLDLAYQIEVLDLLYELNRERGKTIVMVLHDLNQACRYADHLIAVREGKIAAQGDPIRIINHGLVCDVFGVECHIIPDPVTGTPLVLPLTGARRAAGSAGSRQNHEPRILEMPDAVAV